MGPDSGKTQRRQVMDQTGRESRRFQRNPRQSESIATHSLSLSISRSLSRSLTLSTARSLTLSHARVMNQEAARAISYSANRDF